MAYLNEYAGKFFAGFAADPASVLAYVIVIVVIGAFVCWAILRGRPWMLLWSLFALVAGTTFLTTLAQTDDTIHHVYRTVFLVDQVRSGDWTLLYRNKITEEALPVFLFYSFVPYIPLVGLNLLGVPATLVFKYVIVAYLLVYTLGLERLARHASVFFDEPTSDQRHVTYFVILAFAGTYGFSNWTNRAALAEIAVFSLVPWAVVLTIDTKRRSWALFLVTSYQIMCHPIVIPHAFIAQALAVVLLARQTAKELLIRISIPVAAALLFSSAFWFPQYIWESTTLGARGLPDKYEDTFLSLWDLVAPLQQETIGPWLILAASLMTPSVVCKRKPTGIAAVAAFWLLLLAQTHSFYPFTSHLPLLDKSAIVWRLMFTCLVTAFALLLAYGAAIDRRIWRWLAAGAALNACVLIVGHSANHAAGAFPPPLDQHVYDDYSFPEKLWGGLEDFPDYAGHRNICAAVEAKNSADVAFHELRLGHRIEKPYVRIHAGPTTYVDYLIDDRPAQIAGYCGRYLVLGPLRPGGKLRVDETRLGQVLYWRLATVVLFALGLLYAFRLRIRTITTVRLGYVG